MNKNRVKQEVLELKQFEFNLVSLFVEMGNFAHSSLVHLV